jgi:hypothetical protein
MVQAANTAVAAAIAKTIFSFFIKLKVERFN